MQPYTARQVCSGLRQVQTFIFSTLFTTSRLVMMTPASLERRTAVREAVLDDEVLRLLGVDERRRERMLCGFERADVLQTVREQLLFHAGLGRGVILSIMLHGNATSFSR